MAEQEKDRKLDEMLDGLLASYSAAEPRPGLETRILASVREASAKRRPWTWGWNWMWAGAVATAVVVMVALAAYFSRPAQRPRVPEIVRQTVPQPKEQAPPIAQTQTPTPAPQTVARQQPRQRPRTTAPREVADLRQEVFPTPSPLSEQEKLLLHYLAATPREELVAQSHPEEPPADLLQQDQSALPAHGSINQPSNTR